MATSIFVVGSSCIFSLRVSEMARSNSRVVPLGPHIGCAIESYSLGNLAELGNILVLAMPPICAWLRLGNAGQTYFPVAFRSTNLSYLFILFSRCA